MSFDARNQIYIFSERTSQVVSRIVRKACREAVFFYPKYTPSSSYNWEKDILCYYASCIVLENGSACHSYYVVLTRIQNKQRETDRGALELQRHGIHGIQNSLLFDLISLSTIPFLSSVFYVTRPNSLRTSSIYLSFFAPNPPISPLR